MTGTLDLFEPAGPKGSPAGAAPPGPEVEGEPDGRPPDGPIAASNLVDVRRIFLEPAVEGFARGREILARFPDAERVPVESHWRIPELHGSEGLVRSWNRIKRTVLVLGVRKGFQARPNGRSAHFVGPGASNGCAMACAYCYVARRKGFANPITLYVNIEAMLGYLARHAARQGPLPAPDQVDPRCWVYDVGENGDCSVDARLCDNVKDTVALFRGLPNAKATFATKFVNRAMLAYDPQAKTRIRFSLMPAAVARVVDVRTTAMAGRVAAIDDFVRAGYEVHLNFSPVIVRDGWLAEWAGLFREVDAALGARAKAQLACEIIFLTHNDRLHETNLGWHPDAEAMLWRPDLQQAKSSGTGGDNLRYRTGLKGRYVRDLVGLLAREMPYCRVRYAF